VQKKIRLLEEQARAKDHRQREPPKGDLLSRQGAESTPKMLEGHRAEPEGPRGAKEIYWENIHVRVALIKREGKTGTPLATIWLMAP